MIRKYHNHTLQTNSRQEESQNTNRHNTSGMNKKCYKSYIKLFGFFFKNIYFLDNQTLILFPLLIFVTVVNKNKRMVYVIWGPENQTVLKVSNGAKIRNRYNQVPHLTQDTNGKVTNSQKTPQTRAKRSALSQQVTTKHI